MKSLQPLNSRIACSSQVERSSVFIQPKFTINNPNDQYEKEADVVADKLMRMETPMLQTKTNDNSFFKPAPLAITTIQRKCDHCEEEEKNLQRKEMNGEEAAADEGLESYVGTLSSGGQPLPNEVRNFYEPRFGYDFSNVKVHTDAVAAKSARSINALAYTSGNNIVFNEGQYASQTDSGKRLLGHELTHVVQQGSSIQTKNIRRQPVVEPIPHFRDCVPTVTGITNADDVLNAAIIRAHDYVDAAIAVLNDAPTPGTIYETALNTHFGLRISTVQRTRIKRVYETILRAFVTRNFICNRTACTTGRTQAMWDPSDDLLHICVPFWRLDDNCQAIVIIHEGAHDANIDLDDPATAIVEPHTDNRGSLSYPIPGGRRRGRISRSVRMNTPDAYAFFAAHIFNSADSPTDCFI